MTQLVRYEHGRDGMPTWLGWEPSRLFSNFFGWDPFVAGSGAHVENHDDTIVVTVDMPGIQEKDVDLTFEAGVLTIRGKRDDREYHYSTTLGSQIDPDRIEASLDKGVLTVTACKLPAAKPRRIPIGSTKSKASGAKRRLRMFWRKRR